MRLISCHIENFGKLSDFTLSFDSGSGINVICENNGWGKSTLATFIKVMFYGFDNEGRRSEIENERLHYRPWQGGVYGGQLTFEVAGRTYIMSRTFGSKEKNDEFMLRNADTMLESNDFSSNIGEELFLIDRASFMRSIFISQNDCVTATTDGINAKLGNLTDNTNDLNNYETADRKIADMLNSLSGTRKTGLMYKQKEKIAALKQEIKNAERIDASMEELLRMKSDLLGVYSGLKEEQGGLQKRQKEISEYKDIALKKKEYEHLCKGEEQKQQEAAEKKAFFAGGLPDDEELDAYIRLENGTVVLKKELDIYRLSDAEERELASYKERFAGGVPNAEEIEAQNEKIGGLQSLWRSIEKAVLTDEERSSLARFEESYADGVPSKEAIDRLLNMWRARTEKKNMLSAKTAAAEMLELADRAKRENEAAREQEAQENARKENERKEKERRRRKLTMAALIRGVGLIAIVVGELLDFRLPFIVAGAVLFVAGFIWMLMEKRRAADHSESERADGRRRGAEYADAEYADGLSSDAESAGGQPSNAGYAVIAASEPYRELRSAIADDERFISDAENEARRFCDKYGVEYDELGMADKLYRFAEDIGQYERLRKKSQNIEVQTMLKKYDAICADIEGFLRRYGFDAAESNRAGIPDSTNASSRVDAVPQYINALHSLENAVAGYERLRAKDEKYQTAYDEYTKNTERIREFICGLEMEPAQDIHTQLQTIKTALREYTGAYKEYERAAKLKREFEDENADIEKLKAIEEKDDTESLIVTEERLSAISEELEKNHNGILAYERRLEELQEKRDAVSDLERELEELRELYAANEKKLNILKKTQHYLEQAKISLTARYTKPIKDGFDKYFNILSGIEAQNYQLDANLDMSVMEQGMPRKTDFLSAGYKDMVGICMRMALVDAMYKGEKPFVILDDPFVNLDDEKIQGALKLLDRIAKDYQLVYFTCHDSTLKYMML